MAAGTLTHNHRHAPSVHVPTVASDRRQLTEDDADYVRLHAGTVKRLEASIAQYARELRATGGDAHRMAEASSRFVRRHTAILRSAYELAHREGVRDYFAATSKTAKLPHVAPDLAAERKQMAFYAPSVARMAAEGLRTYQETLRGGKAGVRASLRESGATAAIRLADARQGLGDWQQSLAPRVALQAEIVWPAMSDGYLQGGAADVARPFSRVWWRLGPVKTQHCDDCPWMAFNSPYGAPGSGENELWQVPGDGRTACGAGCKCSLELGWEEMPASGNYDWTDFLPPDMYTRNPPAKLPTSEQGTGGLLPGDVARGPIAVDANDNYVYGGTSAERAYYAQMSPHETPYGALSESLAVLPPPSTLAGLDAGELHALDDFRSAWFHWDAVRGELPPAPTLFGAETAPMLQALTRRRYLVRGQFPSWDALTGAQQEALQEVYDAVLEWNAARSGLDTADVEEGALAGAGVGMSEPRDWVQAVALGYPDQPRNHGKYAPSGWVRSTSGGRRGARGGRKSDQEENVGGARAGRARRAASTERVKEPTRADHAKADEMHTAAVSRRKSGGTSGAKERGSRAGGAEPNYHIHDEGGKGRAQLRNMFGRDLSEREIAGLVGAGHGDHVVLQANERVWVHGLGSTTGVRLELHGSGWKNAGILDDSGTYYAGRVLAHDAAGRLVMHNEGIEMLHDPSTGERPTGQGVGTRIFARQVKSLSRLGVDHIETFAAGSKGDEHNGYYTWARLGYNGHFSARQFEEDGVHVPAAFRKLRTIQALMRTPGGADWWKENGDAWNGVFNLKPNSVSMRVLSKYLKYRGISLSERHGPAEEIGWTAEDERAADQAWAEIAAETPDAEDEVQLREPDDAATVALRNDDHSNHGKFTYTGGPGSQGGRAEGEGEAGRAGGHAQEHTAARASGGQRKYTGAKLGPAQRAQQERGLAEDRAQLMRVEHALGQHDAFLSAHEATHPDYERISEQRMRLASAHEALQERINAREDLLGMERSPRRARPPMPEPRGAASGSAEGATGKGTRLVPREGLTLPALKKSYVQNRPYHPRMKVDNLSAEERAARKAQQNREAQARFHARHPERMQQYLDQAGKRAQRAESAREWQRRNPEKVRAAARRQAEARKKAAQQEQQGQQSEQMHELVLPWQDAWELMPDPALVRLVENDQTAQ